MRDDQYYWSERARREFAAVFQDRDVSGVPYSEAFRRSVGEALVHGWSGNRDKPFWAMALVVSALAEAGRLRGVGQRAGKGDGIDLIWLEPDDAMSRLADAAHEGSPETIGWRIEDRSILIATPDGTLRLSPYRLSILRKLAEFIYACDDFAHTNRLGKIWRTLGDGPGGGYGEIKRATRQMARIAYAYRAEHFLDGHAGSAFTIIRNYLAERDFEFDDETIFAFWISPDNHKYQTYEGVFRAFKNFVEQAEEARLAHGAARAGEIDDPSTAREIDGRYGRRGEEAEADALGPLGAASPLGEVVATGDEASELLLVLAESDLRPLAKAEIAILDRLIEVGDFARLHTLASLRLIAFHPVQSGISNGLRTGRSKIPLARRIACEEARSYRAIAGDLERIGGKLRQQMEQAFALASEGDEALVADDDAGRAGEVRCTGLASIEKSRARAMQKDRAELQTAYGALAPALISAKEIISNVREWIARRFPESREPTPDAQFEHDRTRFSQEFRRRYSAHLDDDGADASVPDELLKGTKT